VIAGEVIAIAEGAIAIAGEALARGVFSGGAIENAG
jgi:hypothetical protein